MKTIKVSNLKSTRSGDSVRNQFEKVKNLQRGETIIINESTQIYRYFNGECIVEINNSEEEFCILLDHQNKSLIYESLI